MLTSLLLSSLLIGLSVSLDISNGGIPDPVPAHSAIGGHGEFVHDTIGGSNVLPAMHAIIHDVVPNARSNSIVHDVTHGILPRGGSNAIVRDGVPGPSSRAIVHDITHDVVPSNAVDGFGIRDVTHDVVVSQRDLHGAASAVHDVVPAASKIIHDVVPASASVLNAPVRAAKVVHDVVSRPHLPKLPSFGSPFQSHKTPSSSAVAPSARYPNPAGLKCGLKPEPFIAYQLSRFSYNYPKKDIEREIKQRPEITKAVFSLATKGRFGRQYHLRPSLTERLHSFRFKREAVNTGGCTGELLTLRTFYAYNDYCWLLNPAYQDVNFYNCYEGCAHGVSYGRVSRCEAGYVKRKVLAYCRGLGYGRRIQYVTLPVPTTCSCRTYTCN